MTKHTELQNIYSEYFSISYPIGTGSSEWWDIKSDLELLDNDVIGLSSRIQSKPSDSVDFSSHISFIERSRTALRSKVESYIPKDDLEQKEIEMLIKKFDLLEKIYSLILSGHQE